MICVKSLRANAWLYTRHLQEFYRGIELAIWMAPLVLRYWAIAETAPATVALRLNS